jgi:hypothetical protein
MRKAIIDLDWLDTFIADRHFLNLVVSEDLTDSIKLLEEVRSKCEPIEEPKETFLSKTCINDWESSTYCPNDNKCQMCVSKIKQ